MQFLREFKRSGQLYAGDTLLGEATVVLAVAGDGRTYRGAGTLTARHGLAEAFGAGTCELRFADGTAVRLIITRLTGDDPAQVTATGPIPV